MADEALWELTADAEGVLAAFDEIDAGLSSITEQIDQVAASSESLASLDDILSSLENQTSVLDGSISDLDATMQALLGEVSNMATAMQDAATAMQDATSAMQEMAVAEEDVGTQAGTATEEVSLLGTAMDGLQAAAGPLTMIAGAAAMVGGAMAQTGIQAQDSFSLAQRMAGATSQDIQTLEQHALDMGVGMKQAGDSFYYIESAGYSGSDAIKVFDETTKAAKAGATDAMTVSNALTASLHAYGAGADQAGKYTDMMVQTVVQGKQSFSDFASAIGPLASTAHQTGVSFQEVTAAEATMTQINPHVRQDATDISHLMNSMGLNVDAVAASAKKMGIHFDETAYKGMDFGTKLDYLREITYNNDTAFSKLTGGVAGLGAANDILGSRSKELTDMMGQLNGPMSDVAGTAAQLGLHFDETKFRSMDLMGQLGYLRTITGGNKQEMEKLVGGSKNLGETMDLLSGKSDIFAHNLSSIANSSGATDKAFKASEQTMSASLDHLSSAFSLLSTKVVEAIGPKITPIINQAGALIGQFADMITHHLDQAMPIITGLATALGGILVAALIAFVGPMLAAAAPILGIVAAIALLVAGITFLVTHWSQMVATMQSWGKIPAIGELFKALQEMGNYLVATFKPVIAQVETTFTTQLEPAFKQIWSTLQQATPLFEFLGAIIGGVLVVAFGLLVGIITGVIRAFAALLTGAIQAFGGIVQFISGAIQFIVSLISLQLDVIVALFTGNWGKVGKDLQGVLNGLVTMAKGFGNVFMGVFGGIFLAIGGLVGGFIDGVVGFFTHLYDVLVGHSIIPDMVDAILGVFTHLHDEATQIVSTIVSKIGDFFGGLAQSARTWATDMIQGFLDGLSNMTGQLEAGVKNVAGTVAKFLHFSKPEEGPLADADRWMPDMIDLMTQGLHQQVGKLSSASLNVAATVAQVGTPNVALPAGASAGGLAGGGMSAALLAQIVGLLQQQRTAPLGSAPQQATRGTIIQQFTGANFNGLQDINGIYQALNQLAGIGVEYGVRGVTSGY